jgi:hypothetical protein
VVPAKARRHLIEGERLSAVETTTSALQLSVITVRFVIANVAARDAHLGEPDHTATGTETT